MPVDWLLSGAPFVKYRTMIDLLDLPENDEQVQAARKAVLRHRPIQAILSRQNKDGYWGAPSDIHAWWPRKDTTFWLLGMLADFGLRKDTQRIAAACEYVFSTQHAEGGFGWGVPTTPAECFTGILAEALAKHGYCHDSRLAKAHRWLLSRQRSDGGFWCKNTGQPGGPREYEPSCAFASLCVLSALVQLPTHRQDDAVVKTAQFLLECWVKRGKVKYAGHDSQIGTGWEKLKYPYTDYRILKYVDAISRVPLARSDPRSLEVLDVLLTKRDGDGRFTPESVSKAYSEFDFGQKKLPSRWLTVLAYAAVKRWTTG